MTADLKQVLSKIPLDELADVPAGKPPPGVEPNLVNPVTIAPTIIIVGSVFFGIVVTSVLLRIYTKSRIVRKLGWDDFTCSLGFLTAVVYFSGVILGCRNGSTGRHIWDTSVALTLGYQNLVALFLASCFGTVGLCLIKVTFLLQYYSFFWPLRWVRISVYITTAACVTVYGSFAIAQFIMSSPWPGETWTTMAISSREYTTDQFGVPIGVWGTVLDIILLAIPIRALISLQLPERRLTGLLLIFITGMLASIASCVAIYYRAMVRNPLGDIEWRVGYVIICVQIELFLGLACTCMPSVSKLFSYHAPFIRSVSSRCGWRRLRVVFEDNNQQSLQNVLADSLHPATSGQNSSQGQWEMTETTKASQASHSADESPKISREHEVSVFYEATDGHGIQQVVDRKW